MKKSGLSFWPFVFILLAVSFCEARRGHGEEIGYPMTLEQGECRIEVEATPLQKYAHDSCPEAIRQGLFAGQCRFLWGTYREFRYKFSKSGQPLKGVVEEKFVDLGHNYAPFTGISQTILAQALDKKGQVADVMTWMIRDTPVPAMVFREFAQVIAVDGVPLVINLVRQEITPIGADMRIRHLSTESAEGQAILTSFR